MQKLVIFLHAHDLVHPSWVVMGADAQVMKVVERGDPTLLSADAVDRSVTVIVPAEDVLLTTLTLPKMNRSRLLQAIPYALEEQLIEDVDTMHFAAGDYHANERLAVIVAAHAKMTEWMVLLQSFQIKPDVMIPAIFALPMSDTIWHVAVNDVAVVRTGFASGFACDSNNCAEMLALALSSATVLPEEIMVDRVHGDEWQLTLSVPVKQRLTSSTQLLESMARQVMTAPPVNLLQGSFQNKSARGMPKMTNLIKAAAYMSAALLMIAFLYPVVSFVILDQRASEIKLQIAAIYKRNFPASKNLVAPKERMQQKLNKLTAGIGDNHLLAMIANIGKSLSASSGVQLKRMDFQNNTMTLEISAASSDIFSNFTDSLTQQGLRVKQQNANLNGVRVNATLEIE